MNDHVRNTSIVQRIAELVECATLESQYPAIWRGWTDPISFYIFQANGGDVSTGRVEPFGDGWWLVIGHAPQEIDMPPELLSNGEEAGQLLFPKINFLNQDAGILITETYGQSLCLRRRCNIDQLYSARRIDELPELWRFEHSQ